MDYGKILQAAIAGGLGVFLAAMLQKWWRRKRGLPDPPPPPTHCTKCREPLPQVRRPTSMRQLLWGGWTCKSCGVELDNRGNEIRATPD